MPSKFDYTLQEQERQFASDALTRYQHNAVDLHMIGESIGAPSRVANIGNGIPAAVGQSPFPAREDHIHAVTFPAATAPLWQEFTPAGNTDCDVTGTLADWVVFGNITIPAGTANVQVNLMMAGIYPVTATTGIYNYRVRIGTNNGRTMAFTSPTALSMRVAYQATDKITMATSGSLAFALQMTRTGGAGAMRCDTASDFTAQLWIT